VKLRREIALETAQREGVLSAIGLVVGLGVELNGGYVGRQQCDLYVR
jgi:hypothetical protein